MGGIRIGNTATCVSRLNGRNSSCPQASSETIENCFRDIKIIG